MELGTVISVAETLFSALQSPKLKDVLLIFGYKSQLDELQNTVHTLKAVLCDAETKQELSHQEQDLIEKLKDAVFEADDLFDEFVTLAELKQLRKDDGSLSKKAKDFFSTSKNPFSLAYRMSRGVKDIKKKLDAIAYDKQFSFKIDPEPVRKRRPETCSYVNENEIIGRQCDLDSIVGTLLASDDQRDVSVLSIVGIGGLGKTALAQLVYNDPRVMDAFPLKMWTCVSDEDQKELDVKNILAKILASITRSIPDQGQTLDQVQSRLRDQLAGKKYLLVLDDVWTEHRDQWCELLKYLCRGKTNSWIVVTTRSQETATITGGQTHKLLGLSRENSWRLFERTAFASEQANPLNELVVIGQQIVDGCCGVPLAIRVAGSFLYGQDKSKWLSVQNIGLANIKDDGIKPILKLSFHHLESPLQNCFRYCALFPKDYEMEKDMLISLWMAQGYIVQLDKCQSIADVGEEYFSILTRRCFFQDIKENKYGEIKSCKIHDLMHDIAQTVAGKEVCVLDSNNGNVEKHVCHLWMSNKSQCEKCYSLGKTRIRSLFFNNYKTDFLLAMKVLVKRFRCLRVLILRGEYIKCLPDSIGELMHLRYIDLSYNEEMEALPNSITKLYNLETLMLDDCIKLKELPKELGRLVNLRVLDIQVCESFTCMPRGMGKLSCLHKLKGEYIVGDKGGSYTSWEQFFDGLQDLKRLTNLKGELEISMWWPNYAKNGGKEDGKEGLYLSSMEHLNEITLRFENNEEGERGDDEGVTMKVMENLKPHSNLKRLNVFGYHGVKLYGWETLFLPNLLHLNISFCEELRYLSFLENLRHLKSLILNGLLKLEYIEVEMVSFFPALQELQFEDLPKLKGWRRGEGMEEPSNHLLPCLPLLKHLSMKECPELTCIMVCPMLETLELWGCNTGRCRIVWGTKAEEILSEAATIMENNPENYNVSNAENEVWLNNWKPMESFHSLEYVSIYEDDDLVELPSWMQHLSALETLYIDGCKNLKAMPNWMPKLIALKYLIVRFCSDRLHERCRSDLPGEDWPFIQHILYIDIA